MPTPVIYYISGHGFGHARRSLEVIRQLLALRPDVFVHIRTTAPAAIFNSLPPGRAMHHEVGLDAGAAEADTLTIDLDRTADVAAQAIAGRDQTIAQEQAFIEEQGVRLLLCDAPFLAGDIARAARCPCIAVTNFTWDWIYEPAFSRDVRYAGLLTEISDAYAKMSTLLRLPFPGTTDRIRETIDVPLVTARAQLSRDVVFERLGLDRADDRPRILIAMRGGVSDEALLMAAASAPGMLFLSPYPIPAAAPANLRRIETGGAVDFSDVLSITDVAVSKLGYGTLAECIAAQTALLYPPRAGFREDGVTEAQAPRYLRMRRIDKDSFLAGNWSDSLRALLASSAPPERINLDGAQVCARLISDRLPSP